MLLAELLHKCGELFDAREGHGVVDGGAHAADAAVSLDAAETLLFCARDEVCLKAFARQAEGDVHARAAALFGVSTIEAVGAVDGVVEECRLFRVRFAHCRETAVLLDPADSLADDVDGKDGRRVVEGVVLLEGAVAEHSRELCGAALEQFFLCDVQHDARRAEVFLHARIDEVIAAEVPRA